MKPQSRLGVFWLHDKLDSVIFEKTVLESNVDKHDKSQYGFLHSVEWEHKPKKVTGSYDDYPRGRIYYYDDRYYVEINIPENKDIINLVKAHFNLPKDTLFKFGYW